MLCPLEHPSCLLCFLDGTWGSAGTSATIISLIFVLFSRKTFSVSLVVGFLPPGHYPITVPLHCTLKVFNWLPALFLHTGWVRLSGSAPLPGSGRFSSSPLMWPIASVGGL